MQQENNDATPEIDEIIIKGQWGIIIFIFIFFSAVCISLFKLQGSTLVINVVIHGVFTLVLFICGYFLVAHPIKALTVSLVICSLDSLRYFYWKIFDLLKYEGIGETIVLIILGGIRLIALWLIWSALIGIKNIMKSQSDQSTELKP